MVEINGKIINAAAHTAEEAALWATSAKAVHPSADRAVKAASEATRSAVGVIHDKALDIAQWAASVNTIHPSMHRLLNASFLTAGLYSGRKVMNILTGETPSGKPIQREDVPPGLKQLHGILAYNHFSDKPADRWMKVMDLWTPAAMGAIGAVAGSHVFALDQKMVQEAEKALKAPEKITLDLAEDASVMTQSKPWRMLSGVTSLFGSAAGFQLFPGPTNYGTTLGGSFLGTVRRNQLHTPYMPWLQEFVNSSKHPFPFGPSSMLVKLREYLVHNPDKELKQLDKMSYAILEPWFGEHATPEKVQAFADHVVSVRDKFLREGGIPEHLQEQASKELSQVMHGLGLEKTFEKIGLDPAEATIGRNGFTENFARVLGYDKTLNRISEQYKQGYLTRAGRVGEIVEQAPYTKRGASKWVGRTAMAASAAAVTAGAVNARYWHKRDNDTLLRRAIGKTQPQSTEAKEYKAELEKLDESKAEVATTTFAERLKRDHEREGIHEPNGVINTPLGLMEWGADALNSPETHGMHRVYCAGGLSLGGLIGMKVMDVLTGRTLGGKPVNPEQVPNFLMNLYKKLDYNPHSDHPKDRWGYVLHYAIPALMASAGVVGASGHFFKNKVEAASKANFIDEYETRATMDEAGPWTGLTAATALFVTPSGFNYLPPPFPNYGTALGTRFNLSAGRKVILPVVGDLWTSTASRYPYAPPRLIDHMIHYAANNPDHHPEQLEEMAIGILKPWFENVSKEQVEDFIRHVENDRNKFLQAGGIPEELKDIAELEMQKHFKGAGLEQTLREIGLDPAQAHLGNNGLCGKIAEYLGGSDALEKTRSSFRKKYEKREKARLAEEEGEKTKRQEHIDEYHHHAPSEEMDKKHSQEHRLIVEENKAPKPIVQGAKLHQHQPNQDLDIQGHLSA